MLIDFSLLNGTRKIIECDPNETIANVIPRIVNAFQLENFDIIQLIYKGKKIKDTDEIKSLGYVQSQVVIVRPLGEKPRNLPAPTSQPTSSTSNMAPSEQGLTPNAVIQQQNQPPPENDDDIDNSSNEIISLSHKRPPIALPDPEKWESNLSFLISMGFDEELSVRALIQAYNQPDRAVELIMNDQVRINEQEINTNLPSSTQQPTISLTPPAPPPAISAPLPAIITPPSPSIIEPSLPAIIAPSPPAIMAPSPPLRSTPTTTSPSSSQTTISHQQTESNDNYPNSSHQRLPHPQSHPLPDVHSQSSANNNNDNQPAPENDFRLRLPRGRQLLVDSPPIDPTHNPDDDFEFIRQTLIRNPMMIDNIIGIIQENIDDNDDPQNSIGTQLTSKSSLLLHLFGIRKMETFSVPETYTDDDIANVRRLHELGNFSWDQVIEAYETGERNGDYAEAVLLSLNDFN